MMQYIEHALYFAQDYYVLSAILGFAAAFIESFIPALPLLAIVGINAAIDGFVIGFLITWLGSCVGTITVYTLLRHFFSNHWLEKKRRESPKVDQLVRKIEKNEFKALFLFYAIPVLPSSLFTIAAAICEIEFKEFVPPMMFGKFLMLFVGAFVGSDIQDFIHSPMKIVVVIVMTIVSYFVAKKVKKEMELHEDVLKR